MSFNLKNLKVALVHDYFREFGGAERVVEELHEMFPESDVYTALVDSKNLKIHWYRIKDWRFKISWFGKIPLFRDYPSLFRFLTPQIWEGFNLSNYDLVISSSGWFMCKGVLTRPETLHISYIHHQNKFLTYYETPDDWQQNFLKRIYGYAVGTPLRIWDFIGSQRPDVLVANSQETRKRIQKYYRRDAVVIYPPISDSHLNIKEKLRQTEDYFITVSRLSRPKHIEVLIKAADLAGITLYVVGQGKELPFLQEGASKNIIFTGEISDVERDRLIFSAKGFLNASKDEDFGMAPVEAMMFGVPVIAYESGGLKETVVNGKNGFLVKELKPELFAQKIHELNKYNYPLLVQNSYQLAKRFRKEEFRRQISELIINNLRK